MNDKKYLTDLSDLIKQMEPKNKDKNTSLEFECRFEIDYQIVDIVKKLNQTQEFYI